MFLQKKQKMLPQDERNEIIVEMEETIEDLKKTIQQHILAKDREDMQEVMEDKPVRKQAVAFIKENARSAITSTAYAAKRNGMNILPAKGKFSTMKDKVFAGRRFALQYIDAEQREKLLALKEGAMQKLRVLHKKGCLLLDDIISSPAAAEMQMKVQKGIENGLKRLGSLKDRED